MGRRPNPDVHYEKMQRLIRRLARTPVDPARLAEIDAIYTAAAHAAKATATAITQQAPRVGTYQHVPGYCGWAWLTISESDYDTETTAALCRLGHVRPRYQLALSPLSSNETEGVLWVAEAGCAVAAAVLHQYLGQQFEIWTKLD